MELIPILSTIILVATISTFLLAIGAYVLYKIRERKGQRAAAPQPSSVRAEIVTPSEMPQQEPVRVSIQPTVEKERVRVQRQPIFIQPQVQPAGRTTQKWYTPQPKQYSGESAASQRGYEAPFRSQEESPESKFYKYTSEGYVSAKEDNKSGALKWR